VRKSSTLKGVALAATATLVLGFTAACGSSSDDSSNNADGASGGATTASGPAKAPGAGSTGQTPLGKTDTLTITTFGDFGYGDLIKQWNADPSSPFQVKERQVSKWDDWKGEMMTDLQAGSGLPDIVAVEGDSMPEILAVSDQFVDLTDPAVKGRWVAFKEAAGQNSAGQQIGYPTDAGPEGMCYREDLFKKAGLPTDTASIAADFATWDSYFATGQKLVQALPKTKWYDSTGSIAQAMLNQTPFPFQTADNTVDVTDPELKQVFDTLASHEDLSTKVAQWGTDWTANFKDDGFATTPCPGWQLGNVKTNAPDVTGWRLADAFPGGGGNWGGSFLTVPEQSTHQKEAMEFANWLTDAKQEVGAFDKIGAFPSNVEAEKTLAATGKPDPYFGGDNTAAILAHQASLIKPNLPYKGDKYGDILTLFQNATLAVDQGTAPDAAWSQFTSQVGQL
jgi:cellobiose transport system substrate-binding protein